MGGSENRREERGKNKRLRVSCKFLQSKYISLETLSKEKRAQPQYGIHLLS